jgi:predicted AAA+ superfamily ATPase
VGKEMRKYGNQPEISYRKLSEASGVSANTIMQYVKLLEAMEDG